MGPSASLPARVWAQVGLIGMLLHQGAAPERWFTLLDEAVALARTSGDALAIALATSGVGFAARMGYSIWRGLLDRIACRVRALPPQPWIARNLTLVEAGFGIALGRGDLDTAETICLRALERMRPSNASTTPPTCIPPMCSPRLVASPALVGIMAPPSLTIKQRSARPINPTTCMALSTRSFV